MRDEVLVAGRGAERGDASDDGCCGRCEAEIVGLDACVEGEGGAGFALAVGAVAAVGYEGRGGEGVCYGVAGAVAG